jgi:hypothetical protein
MFVGNITISIIGLFYACHILYMYINVHENLAGDIGLEFGCVILCKDLSKLVSLLIFVQ